jgi:hypothetical protein
MADRKALWSTPLVVIRNRGRRRIGVHSFRFAMGAASLPNMCSLYIPSLSTSAPTKARRSRVTRDRAANSPWRVLPDFHGGATIDLSH